MVPLGYVTEVKRQLNIYKNVRSWLEDFFLILQTKVTETVDTDSRLEVFSEFYARKNRAYLMIDGTWQLDSTYRLNGYRTEEIEFCPARLTVSAEIKAQIELNSHLRIENDLWYLDGTYTLNGEKMLDAEIFDYDL